MELRQVKKYDSGYKLSMGDSARVVIKLGEQHQEAWADTVYAHKHASNIVKADASGAYGKEQLRKLGVYV